MIDQSFDVDGAGRVELRISSGRIEIKRGQVGRIGVMVSGTTSDLTVEQRGSVVYISTERKGILVSRGVHITLEVGDGCDVQASVASADVTSEAALGQLEVNAASGDIRFTEASELTAKTASGDVRGANLDRCHFVSASGDLHLGTIGGRADVSTASGDIHIDNAGGALSTSTMSGDVYVRVFSGEEFKSKSMSGSVRLGIPAGTRVDLDVNTMTGEILLPEPATTEPPSAGPTATVYVKTVSGDLRINRVS